MILGELLSIGSAATWAVGVILYRQLGSSLPPFRLNFLKNLLVLGMLIPAIPLLHGLSLPSMSAGEIILTMISGMVGLAIADTMYFWSLNRIGASRMGIIGNLYSPVVIGLSFIFLAERLTLIQIGGFVLVSAGVWLAVHVNKNSATQQKDWRAIICGIVAVSLMAVAIVMVKRVLEAQPLLWVTLIRMIGALLGMCIIGLIRSRTHMLFTDYTRIPWLGLIVAAFVGQFLSMVLWLGGYKYADASIAAILNETSSVFILLLAAFWLKEPMTQRMLIGVILTMTGILVMLISSMQLIN